MRRIPVKLELTMTEARVLLMVLKSVERGWMLENILDYLHDAIEDGRRAAETVEQRQARQKPSFQAILDMHKDEEGS